MIWKKKAKDFVRPLRSLLWQNEAMLMFLRSLGLSDAQLQYRCLGYNPQWTTESFEDWGINPEKLPEQDRAKGCVTIPDGIVGIIFEDFHPVALGILRPHQRPEYGVVMGSQLNPWGYKDCFLGRLMEPVPPNVDLRRLAAQVSVQTDKKIPVPQQGKTLESPIVSVYTDNLAQLQKGPPRIDWRLGRLIAS